MCLYPNKILNKKYMPTRKNNFARDLQCKDERTKYIEIPCGNCMECRRKISNSWRIRLLEEIKQHKHKYFVTLTFDDDHLIKLCNEIHTQECNAVATLAVRRFLERYRKKYKKSCKHWLITELGHTETERIHLHGVIMPEQEMSNDELQNIWKYGITDNGQYVNEKTINYIVKYVTKYDNDHKEYKPVVLCSPAIGKNYISDESKKLHRYRPKETRDYYILNTGDRVQLPTYYRNKLYTEDEREKLWIERLDEDKKYINGIEVKNATKNENLVNSIRRKQRELNNLCEYGTDQHKDKPYNVTKHNIDKAKRIEDHNFIYIDKELLQAHAETRRKTDKRAERDLFWEAIRYLDDIARGALREDEEQAKQYRDNNNYTTWHDLKMHKRNG